MIDPVPVIELQNFSAAASYRNKCNMRRSLPSLPLEREQHCFYAIFSKKMRQHHTP
jgi:hypothetical protein